MTTNNLEKEWLGFKELVVERLPHVRFEDMEWYRRTFFAGAISLGMLIGNEDIASSDLMDELDKFYLDEQKLRAAAVIVHFVIHDN